MFTFNQGEWSGGVMMQGVERSPENGHDVLFNVVGNHYLKTFGIPLLAGRNFNAQDTAKSPQVAIVNETFAKRFSPTGSALGRRFCVCDGNPAHGSNLNYDIEIVGVVRDAHYVAVGEGPEMAVYFPYPQHIQYFGNLSVRSSGAVSALVPAVRRAVAQANPNIAVAQAVSLGDQVTGSMATQRLIGILSAFFAALAVFLAAIGVYGLMSYSVVRRTSEIGIRLALGAHTRTLLWLVFRESLVLLAAGLVVGIPIAIATCVGLANMLKGQLYQVNSLDPMAFAAAGAVISAMTLLAAWLPARGQNQPDCGAALRVNSSRSGITSSITVRFLRHPCPFFAAL
jgi:hypothetical protein